MGDATERTIFPSIAVDIRKTLRKIKNSGN